MDIRKLFYESSLVTGEQTEDAIGKEDYGSYCLQEVTVEDIVNFLDSHNLLKGHKTNTK